MRTKTLVAVVVLGGFAAATVAGPVSAKERCLQVGHVKYTHMVDSTTMQAESDRGSRYTVKFTAACRVGGTYTWNHFVYTDLQIGTCFSAGDVMPTSQLGPCFIKSVTPDESDG